MRMTRSRLLEDDSPTMDNDDTPVTGHCRAITFEHRTIEVVRKKAAQSECLH